MILFITLLILWLIVFTLSLVQLIDLFFYLPKRQERMVATHEAGHLVAAWACTHVNKISKAFIRKNEGRVEYTIFTTPKASGAWCNLAITLAGIAAEVFVYKKVLLNSKQDIEAARKHIEELILIKSFSPYWKPPKAILPSRLLKAIGKINEQELLILQYGYDMAYNIVMEHKHFNNAIALLIEKKTVCEEDVVGIFGTRAFIKALFPSQRGFVL